MTPTEFKQARQELGLSSRQLAHILNCDERTIRRWEDTSGTRPPNPIACRIMRWMLDGFKPPEWPDSQK